MKIDQIQARLSGTKLLRTVITLASLLIAVSAFAQKQDVVIWGVSLGPDSKGVEAQKNEFARRFPQYNVRLLSMGAGKMDPQKLMTSIVGNVAPDVVFQDRFTIGDWASRGAFMSLDHFLQTDKTPMAPKPSQYYPAAWQEASYGGKVYGIPIGVDDRILYWNKGIFKEKSAELTAAGLDPNRAPRTWSEVLAYSKVLTEFNPDGTLKRAGFLPNFGNPWLYIYSFQNNAYFMGEDDPKNMGRRCTLDNPYSEEALQFMVKGYDLVGGYERAKSFETGFLGKENDAFIIGKVAMKIDGDWILADLGRYGPHLDMDTAPAPVPDDRYYHRGRFANEKETFVTWIGGSCYSIPKGARNAQGGWDYIKFVTSTEGRLIEARAQRDAEHQRGRIYIPRLAASIEANAVVYKEFQPADPKFAHALKNHIDMLDHARIRPVTFVGQLLWNEHTRAMENASIHAMSPKQALLAGQAKVQGELDAFFDKEKYPIVDLRIPATIFGLLLLGCAITFYASFRKQKLGAVGKAEAKWGFLMISPWVIGFLVFTLGPMLASLFFSFTQYNVLQDARWVGIKNYSDMVTTDRDYVMKALSNAAYMAGIGTPLALITGLAIALLLNAAVRGIRVYRTLFYMPAIVPVMAASMLWIWLLAADPHRGLINGFWDVTISKWLHLPPPGWTQSEAWSKPGLILMGIWGAGGGMILWLAGLKGVSSSLYEAASLDGATPGKQFWSVTLPQLSPIIFFNMVMGIIGAMQEFDRIYIMKPSSDGPVGPADSMLMPVYHLFTNGFAYFRMGYASALAWALFLIILLLTLFQLSLSKRWVYSEVEE